MFSHTNLHLEFGAFKYVFKPIMDEKKGECVDAPPRENKQQLSMDL